MFLSGIADEAGKELETQIRAHKDIGFDHIEVRNVGETTLAYASDEEFDQIHAQLNEAGLQVSCFASQLANWAREITGPLDKDIDDTAGFYGLGLRLPLNDNLRLSVEFERFLDVGKDRTFTFPTSATVEIRDSDINLYSVGAVWMF